MTILSELLKIATDSPFLSCLSQSSEARRQGLDKHEHVFQYAQDMRKIDMRPRNSRAYVLYMCC